uniref:Uncharacterized protein n=1 Tax=Romanomermis culicivorax TaxID=13658 RepID=A0A915KAN7_ROMCU
MASLLGCGVGAGTGGAGASQLKNIDVVMIPGFDRPMAYSIGRSCAEPTFRILYNGSLAYSFDIGNIHFVQLQNYPSYENYWYSKVYSRNSSDYCPYKGMITFNIRSSLDWLENDLREASTQDKHIVLCFHDPCEYFKFDAGAERFKRLIIEYHVAGIFAGHFRYKHGIYRHFPKRYADVPIFACGAPIYGTFLRVIFYPRNQTMMSENYW